MKGNPMNQDSQFVSNNQNDHNGELSENFQVENQNFHCGAPSETTPLAISSNNDHEFARDVKAQFNQVIPHLTLEL